MHHSFIDRYSDGGSFLHRLDARTKIAVVFLYAAAVVLTPKLSPGRFAGCFLGVFLLMVLSRVPLVHFFRRSLVMLPFILVTSISALFAGASTTAGLLLVNVAKAFLVILSMVLLSATTRFPDLLKGLERCGVPRILVMLAAFMYRYLFVVLGEAMVMERSRLLRSFGRRSKAAVYASLAATLFIRSFERGERVYQSMLARGFSARMQSLSRSCISSNDLLFLAGAVCGLAGVQFL